MPPLFTKYPYLIDLKKLLSRLYGSAPPIGTLINIPRFRKHAIELLESAIKGKEFRPIAENEVVAIIGFYISLIIANAAGRWVVTRLADRESKWFVTHAITEESTLLEKIGRAVGARVEYLGGLGNPNGLCVDIAVYRGEKIKECYPYRMPIPSYLRGIETLRTQKKWMLVNRVVSKGYVYLSKRDLVRVLSEFVKRKVLRLANEYSTYLSEVPEDSIKEDVERLRGLVKDVRGFTEERLSPEAIVKAGIREEFFPPCITNIMNALLRGEHLSHAQRFALATFLLNAGADVEYVLDVFRHAPDFNEKIARYQIEHLAGLRGSRKKYSVYSCDKMKALGMCVAECGAKTPLQYYFREYRKHLRKTRSSHGQGDAAPSEH